jgi:MarR family transcriptional regulator, lower aerobic nicotinate degradation pathway regulator
MPAITTATNMRKRTSEFDFHSAPGHLIRRAHQRAVAIFNEETEDFAITPIQFALLSELARHPEIDQVTLATQIAIDVATLGQVAMRLEDRGLIAREGDSNDRRRKRLVITASGHHSLRQVECKIAMAQDRIMAPLTQRETEMFLRLLRKLVRFNDDVRKQEVSETTRK